MNKQFIEIFQSSDHRADIEKKKSILLIVKVPQAQLH